MSKEQDFLSEQEIEELRREIDALVANVDSAGGSGAGALNGLHSLEPLAIEENM